MSEPTTEKDTAKIRQMHKDNGSCRRCGDHLWGLFSRITTLIGDYHTILCPDCLNDFSIYIKEQPAFERLALAQTEEHQVSFKVMHDGESRVQEIMAVREQILAAQKELFTIAETFCSDLIERPAPPPPPPPTPEEISELRTKRLKRLRSQISLLEREEKEAQSSTDPLPPEIL